MDPFKSTKDKNSKDKISKGRDVFVNANSVDVYNDVPTFQGNEPLAATKEFNMAYVCELSFARNGITFPLCLRHSYSNHTDNSAPSCHDPKGPFACGCVDAHPLSYERPIRERAVKRFREAERESNHKSSAFDISGRTPDDDPSPTHIFFAPFWSP